MLNTIILENIASMDDQEVVEALNEILTLKDISFEEAQTLYQIIEPYLQSEKSEVVNKTIDVVEHLVKLYPKLADEVKTTKRVQETCPPSEFEYTFKSRIHRFSNINPKVFKSCIKIVGDNFKAAAAIDEYIQNK